eukprot:c16495_g1_i3.p1 GENE.c16495_g1_i3~~c16495_g1_i3.p1  ORF type:complete len:635 (+),score=115.71 c16495_g1_i3:66-1970(+)
MAGERLFSFAFNVAVAVVVVAAVVAEFSLYWTGSAVSFDRNTIGLVFALVAIFVAPSLWFWRGSLLYIGIRAFVQLLLNFFFREIAIKGLENIPAKGPVIIVGSHRNQFVDGAVMLVASPRHLCLTMAAASFNRPVVGWTARGIGCIPIHRPQDEARPGAGFVTAAVGATRVVGSGGSRFTSDVHAGDSLMIGEQTLAIASVLSDTELELAAPLASELAGVAYRLLPKVDHSQMFSAVFDELARGGTVALFPEGGSHDRTHMLPLKAGVALMALGSVERYPDLKVTIVPCGISYSAGGYRFRSKCVVDYGEPIVVDAANMPLFKSSKREAVGGLLSAIEAGLRSVTLNVPDHEFLEFVLTVKRLYQPPTVVLSSAQSFALIHRFAEGLQMPSIQAEPGYAEIKRDVMLYRDLCQRHGHNPYSSVIIRRSLFGIRAVPQLLVVLAFSLLAAVPGLLLNAPVGLLAKFLAERQAVIALKKSAVKIKGLDVVASYKLLVILVGMPVWYGIVTAGLLWLTPLRWSVVIPLALTMPLFSYIGIRFTEQGVIWSKSVTPLLFRALPSYRADEERLLLLQDDLRARIQRFVDVLDHPYKDNRIVPREQIEAEAPSDPFASTLSFGALDSIEETIAKVLGTR